MGARAALLLQLVFFALFNDGLAQLDQFSRFGEIGTMCSSYQFRCKSGQCIASESVCDGSVDCTDGSDETRDQCSGPGSATCGPRAFRCDYGACVDGDAVCNRVRDCADNSDESPERCSRDNQFGGSTGGQGGQQQPAPVVPIGCRPGQFRCDNGQCVPSTSSCDGAIDCLDKSDETEECASYICPEYAFRCRYGACIDARKKCDGDVNCADGSDESRILCSSENRPWPTTQQPPKTTKRPSSQPVPSDPYNVSKPRPTQSPYPSGGAGTATPRPQVTQRPQTAPVTQRPSDRPDVDSQLSEFCKLPPQPSNGEYKLDRNSCQGYSTCLPSSGMTNIKPGVALYYSCDPGYTIKGPPSVYCQRSGMLSEIPTCEQIRCRPLSSASTDAKCMYEDNWVSCDSPVLPKTTAQLSCRNSYTRDTTDLTRRENIRCNANGEWEPHPIKCVSVCGVASTGYGTPLVVNGSRATVSDFPWHGTLYRAKGPEKQFICGASIIKDDLLVTAAHCVYDESEKKTGKPSLFYVAVGNVYREYDYEGNDQNTVKKTRVKKIFIDCKYLGLNGNYASDIAILQVEKPFVFSSIVMPVCLDLSPSGDQAVLELGNYGKVAGFGRTAKGESSFILQYLTVPYVPLSTCKSSSKESESEKYITIDKFCAGYTNGSSVCDGDSGGGLVFKTDNKWYLRGIVSVGLGFKKEGATRYCDSYAYSLYTRVSRHMEWIQDIILRLETNKQISCT
ncbi:hypothetical protein QAD02_022079 [Eretmocerus hayati]|uniref:Uncharacterized protein n=1 Tax=Eretmocerus hayati TaxID=131215 RepID=A0ACC2PS99_9HYME|nr:hypothetical protein QAD02_022079 [Eretmocerus hayati]